MWGAWPMSLRARPEGLPPTSEMRSLLITWRGNGAKNLMETGVLGDALYPSPFGNQKEYLNASCRIRGSCELVIWPKVGEPDA
jgi:hypothetical protein